MFEGIKKIFESEPEEEDIEVSRENIPSFLRKEYADELEGLDEEAEEKLDEIFDNIEDMKEALDVLKGADAFRDHQMVKDVKKSFTRRKKNVLDIERPEIGTGDLRKFCNSLESKFDEFSELTPKQEFVLNKQSEAKSKIYKAFGKARDSKNDLEEFIDNKLSRKKVIERMESLNESIETKLDKIEELELENSRLESEIEEKESEKSELRERKEELEEGREARKLRELKEGIERAERDKKKVFRRSKAKISGIERVLKKFKHLVDSGERSLSRDKLSDLESLLGGKFLDVETGEIFEQVESAIELGEIELKSKKRKNFDKLRQRNEIESLKAEYREKGGEIKEMRSKLEEFQEFIEKKERVYEHIDDKENEIESLKGTMKNNEKKVEDLKNEIESIEERIFREADEMSSRYNIRPEN